MFRYFTLDDFDFKGKVVGVRVDINSPIIDGKVVFNQRIVAASKTISELIQKGAKVVVLAHQGRKGSSDCVSLNNHKKFIEKEIDKLVDFTAEIYSVDVEKNIKNLNFGDVLILENLRFFDDEKDLNKSDNLILKLEKLFDFYVFDAFSVSHREQTSVVGFKNIPIIAGRTMQDELEGLNGIVDTKSPHVFLFGGAKPDDLVELIESALVSGKVDTILLTGIIGEIALYLTGCDIGLKYQFLKEKGYLKSIDKIDHLLKKYGEYILLPKDVAYFDGKKRVEVLVSDLKSNSGILGDFIIQDIGKSTVNFYKNIIDSAGSIYFKGPAGNFEDKNFIYGSKELISKLGKSNAFTFMGGGHSVTALEKFAKLTDFSYVSLAGGALVKFLSGKDLVGVLNLENSFSKFDGIYDDFVVIGSNVIDTDLQLPLNFGDVHLGDKIKIEEDFKQSVGGGGVNVSVCLARLGARVGYLGKMSYESIDLIRDILNKNKVNLIKSKISKKSSAKSILVDTKDGDRVIFTYRGQNEFLELSDFNSDDFISNNYYLTSLLGTSFETIYQLVKIIKNNNIDAKICYNISLNLIKKHLSKLKILLKNVDILVLNYEEAEGLVGECSIGDCLRKCYAMTNKYGVVVITDGANGSFAYDGNIEYFQDIVKVKKIVDTTGAGDSFSGSFFYFYSKGYGIKKAMDYAAKNSSSVVCYKGSQPGLKYYEDLVK